MSNDYNIIRRKAFGHYFLIPLLLKKLKKVYIKNVNWEKRHLVNSRYGSNNEEVKS